MTTYNTGNPLGSTDPRDLYDNSKNLDEAVNSDSSSFTDRLGKLRPTLKGSIDPTGLASAAAASAQRSEAARDAAFINADVFEDTAAGISGTNDGEQFQVVDGDEVVRYLNDNGSPVEVARYPGSSRVGELASLLSERDSDVAHAFPDRLGFYKTYIDKSGAIRSPTLDGVKNIIEVELDSLALAVIDSHGFIGFGIAGDGELLGFERAGQDEQVILSFCEPWGDPSTDIALTWLSTSPVTLGATYIQDGREYSAPSIRSRKLPVSGFYLHTAHLSALHPDTIYPFTIGDYEDSLKTSARVSVRVSSVSDYQQYDFEENSQIQRIGSNITSDKTDILLLNGDYINDNGRYTSLNTSRWIGMLTAIYNWYRTDGALIPTIATVGNHEGARNNAGEIGGNAFSGGKGFIAHTRDIFSFGYSDISPNRFLNSAMSVEVGDRLGIVCLETDHTEPLFVQKEWFKTTLERMAYTVEHVIIAGHVGPFTTYNANTFRIDTQARELRKNFFAVAQEFPNIRAWLEGHTHKLEIKRPLKYDYDDQLSEEDNDVRWYADPNGIRCIGSGPWGADRRDITDYFQNLESSIDSSTLTEAALYMREGAHQTIGNITNPSAENMWHHWDYFFEEGGHTIRAIGIDGSQLYEFGS